MKKKINIYFTDFWKNFNINSNFIIDRLSEYYDVIINKKPDYLFCSVFGQEYLNYNCIRICYNEENLIPDFSSFDYVMSMHDISFDDRYLKTFAFYINSKYNYCFNKVLNKTIDHYKKNKFCAFIYSNGNADKKREEFFDLLCEYKKVDSGGKFRNNIGYQVDDKMEFLRDYKFSIAFENSTGYITEKIFEAMAANTIPIYWGEPRIGRYVNVKSFINCNDFENLDEVVDYIKKVNEDNKLYNNIFKEPWVTRDQYIEHMQFEERFDCFMKNIFEQPYDKAFRRPRGQRIIYVESNQRRHYLRDLKLEKYRKIPKLFRKLLNKIINLFRK